MAKHGCWITVGDQSLSCTAGAGGAMWSKVTTVQASGLGQMGPPVPAHHEID
jgi:hypothetical protein